MSITKSGLINGLITFIDRVQSGRQWIGRNTGRLLRAFYNRAYTDTIVAIRLHAMYGEDTLYNIGNILGMIRFSWTHSVFKWSHWKMMNYALKLPRDYDHLFMYDPTMEIVFYKEGFRKLLCQHYEVTNTCVVLTDDGALIDHMKLLDLVTDIASQPRHNIMAYELGGIDITPYMKDLYVSNRVTVHDLSLYMYHTHSIMIRPDNCKLVCILDNEYLDTVEYYSDDMYLFVPNDTSKKKETETEFENEQSGKICLIDAS